MARLLHTVQAPDGSIFTKSVPDHCHHTVAVLGYMRLRKALPKLNPDDPHEETRWERFKAWVLIGTSENQLGAEHLAACQGYRNVTEQVVYVPTIGVPIKKNAASVDHDEDGAPATVGAQAVDLDAM